LAFTAGRSAHYCTADPFRRASEKRTSAKRVAFRPDTRIRKPVRKKVRPRTVRLVKVLRFRAGFPQAGRSSQIPDELQIFSEKVGLHFPKARRQQSGVTIQTFPEGPFFVARGWSSPRG
jgi:hypothetical protein